MEVTLGFSPCPNDTFIFNALVNGPLQPAGHRLHVTLQDVETLNRMAFEERLDITKLSFYAWLKARDHYRLLSSGGALGYGCGPLVIAAESYGPDDMDRCRIVLPGKWTTAHLLFRMWAPQAHQRRFISYDKIFDALRKGEADCGVIIHESRFTFESAGFRPVIDLGAWWEEQTGLPIPLGCIAVHRRLPLPVADQLDQAIRESIRQARCDPDAALPYIRAHAREMTAEVLRAHIDTFVNEFSLDLGEKGREAVQMLEMRARQAGALP